MSGLVAFWTVVAPWAALAALLSLVFFGFAGDAEADDPEDRVI